MDKYWYKVTSKNVVFCNWFFNKTKNGDNYNLYIINFKKNTNYLNLMRIKSEVDFINISNYIDTPDIPKDKSIFVRLFEEKYDVDT